MPNSTVLLGGALLYRLLAEMLQLKSTGTEEVSWHGAFDCLSVDLFGTVLSKNKMNYSGF